MMDEVIKQVHQKHFTMQHFLEQIRLHEEVELAAQLEKWLPQAYR